MLHVTAVQPGIRSLHKFTRTGFDVEADSIDDGTEPTSSYFARDGEFVEVVDVQRRLGALVAFAKWEGAPYDMEVVPGLRQLWGAIGKVVERFACVLL